MNNRVKRGVDGLDTDQRATLQGSQQLGTSATNLRTKRKTFTTSTTRSQWANEYPSGSKVPVVKYPSWYHGQVVLVTIGAEVVAGVVTEPCFCGLLVEGPVTPSTSELLLS